MNCVCLQNTQRSFLSVLFTICMLVQPFSISYSTSAPPLFQHLKISIVFLCITYFTRAINSCDNRTVASQYTNRWLLSSWSATIYQYILAKNISMSKLYLPVTKGRSLTTLISNQCINRFRRKMITVSKTSSDVAINISYSRRSVVFRKAIPSTNTPSFIHFTCSIVR